MRLFLGVSGCRTTRHVGRERRVARTRGFEHDRVSFETHFNPAPLSIESFSGRGIPLDRDAPRVPSRLCHVVGELLTPEIALRSEMMYGNAVHVKPRSDLAIKKAQRSLESSDLCAAVHKWEAFT